MESTAEWGAHQIYPGDEDRHRFISGYLDHIEHSVSTFPYPHKYFPYGQYLLPEWVTLTTGSKSLALDSYEAWSTPQGDVFEAANSVLPGGFHETWPAYTLATWNDPPVALFEDAGQHDSGTQVDDGHNMVLGAGYEDSFEITDTELPFLSARVFQFEVVDPTIRGLMVHNPWHGEDHLHLNAILEGDGDFEPRHEDWTDRETIPLCLDREDERARLVTLIASNARWQHRTAASTVKPSEPLLVVASNVGCWRWKGTSSMHQTNTLEIQEGAGMVIESQVDTEFTFEAVRDLPTLPPDIPQPTIRGTFFEVTGGTITAHRTQTNHYEGEEPCTTTVDKSVAIEPPQGHMWLHTTSDDPGEGQLGQYSGYGAQMIQGGVSDCSGDQPSHMFFATWFVVEDDPPSLVSASGDKITGSWTEVDGDKTTTHSWTLEAVKD